MKFELLLPIKPAEFTTAFVEEALLALVGVTETDEVPSILVDIDGAVAGIPIRVDERVNGVRVLLSLILVEK